MIAPATVVSRPSDSTIGSGSPFSRGSQQATLCVETGRCRGILRLRFSASSEFLAKFSGALVRRADRRLEFRLDVVVLHGGDRGVGGAALGRHAFTQYGRRLDRVARQGRGAGKGANGKSMRLFGRQS